MERELDTLEVPELLSDGEFDTDWLRDMTAVTEGVCETETVLDKRGEFDSDEETETDGVPDGDAKTDDETDGVLVEVLLAEFDAETETEGVEVLLANDDGDARCEYESEFDIVYDREGRDVAVAVIEDCLMVPVAAGDAVSVVDELPVLVCEFDAVGVVELDADFVDDVEAVYDEDETREPVP